MTFAYLLTLLVSLGAMVLLDRRFRLFFWRGPTRAAIVLAALIPAGYQLFRMGYFATVVPNTALAKGAGSVHWGFGLNYLHEFIAHYAGQWRELDPEAYPFVHHIIEEFARHDDREQFRAGLDLLLAGLRLQAGG